MAYPYTSYTKTTQKSRFSIPNRQVSGISPSPHASSVCSTKTVLANNSHRRNFTDHFDVLEAREDQVLQQFTANPPSSHHQDLAGVEGVRQLFSKGTDQLDHDVRLKSESVAPGG